MHRVKSLVVVSAAAAGFGAAALLGVAVAKSFTLQVANATVSGNQQSIVVNTHGHAVYELTGDRKSHPECTSTNCMKFWPPVKVASAKNLSKAPGINGKLGVWHHDGFSQVTLGGHPLYTFAGDTRKHAAAGEGIMSFGGTWHVIKVPGSASGSNGAGGGSSTSDGGYPGGSGYPSGSSTQSTGTTTTSTSPPTCLYPPCY